MRRATVRRARSIRGSLHCCGTFTNAKWRSHDGGSVSLLATYALDQWRPSHKAEAANRMQIVRNGVKVRRVITSHDDNGKAVVKIDEIVKNTKVGRPGAV